MCTMAFWRLRFVNSSAPESCFPGKVAILQKFTFPGAVFRSGQSTFLSGLRPDGDRRLPLRPLGQRRFRPCPRKAEYPVHFHVAAWKGAAVIRAQKDWDAEILPGFCSRPASDACPRTGCVSPTGPVQLLPRSVGIPGKDSQFCRQQGGRNLKCQFFPGQFQDKATEGRPGRKLCIPFLICPSPPAPLSISCYSPSFSLKTRIFCILPMRKMPCRSGFPAVLDRIRRQNDRKFSEAAPGHRPYPPARTRTVCPAPWKRAVRCLQYFPEGKRTCVLSPGMIVWYTENICKALLLSR